MLELGIKLLISYLVGSVSGSLLMGRLSGGVDIRTEGSGNAGATNALRTHGLAFALPVVLIDIAKGALAVWWIAPLSLAAPGFASDVLLGPDYVAACCGAAAVIGHVWPFWHDFRGGKGAATLVGAYLVLATWIVPILVVVWLAIIVATGYVGLATIIAATSVPLFFFLNDAPSSHTGLGVFMALLIVFAHRANVTRLFSGTENRMTRAMFWRRRPNP